jgi:hypothetical protein
MATTLGGQGKGQAGDGQHQEKRKKESILDLTKYLEKPVRVKFAGKSSALGLSVNHFYGSQIYVAWGLYHKTYYGRNSVIS